MKEYTIKMSFSIEAETADYEKVSEFAEKLSESIMNDDDLISSGDIEVIDISVEEVEDHNDDGEDYLDDEDDDDDWK
jgi:hypothetical protein